MPRPGPPPRQSKYQPIADFLAIQEADSVRLPFAAIETILGFPLPMSAYVISRWWRNRALASVRTWVALGWEARLMHKERVVVFTRIARSEE